MVLKLQIEAYFIFCCQTVLWRLSENRFTITVRKVTIRPKKSRPSPQGKALSRRSRACFCEIGKLWTYGAKNNIFCFAWKLHSIRKIQRRIENRNKKSTILQDFFEIRPFFGKKSCFSSLNWLHTCQNRVKITQNTLQKILYRLVCNLSRSDNFHFLTYFPVPDQPNLRMRNGPQIWTQRGR